MMGLIGVDEILYMLKQKGLLSLPQKDRQADACREEWEASTGPMTRAAVTGFIIGLIPGGSAISPRC
jgi:putative tricarboxylic transport membrane protein